MKKIIVLVMMVLSLLGCNMSNTPSNEVERYLDNFNNLSDEVIMDVDSKVSMEELNNENKEIYKKVLLRQYENMKYEITDESIERIPIARMGEKSMLPKRNQPLLENRFKYGSVILEINLPNFVNFAPGIQVMKIEIKHKTVYIIIIAEIIERTVPIIILLFQPDILYERNGL